MSSTNAELIIPKECQNELKIQSKVEDLLTGNKENYEELQVASKIEKHTFKNYPNAN
jgi:hypothetical protein